jgi:Acetyltransferases, including N-acetylases of ribosomal proteins
MEDALDMFYNWASDPEVCKYLSWGPHSDIDVTRRRITYWLNNYQRDNFYVWAIEQKNKNMVVGTISVEIVDESTLTCEIGYCLCKEYWGRGIMTESLRTVMHFLFYEVGFQRIVAKHDVQNIASGMVMLKAGMHFTKYEYKVGVRRDGSYYDCAVYEKRITDE